MKSDNQEFLDDVLDSSDEFRAAVLKRTLRSVRRRKFIRKSSRVCVTAFILGLCAWTWWSFHTLDQTPALPERTIVQHRKVLPFKLVTTRSDAFQMIHTEPSSDVQIVSTKSASSHIEYLSDENLLSLFSGRPVALISANQHKKELVFLDRSSVVDPQ